MLEMISGPSNISLFRVFRPLFIREHYEKDCVVCFKEGLFSDGSVRQSTWQAEMVTLSIEFLQVLQPSNLHLWFIGVQFKNLENLMCVKVPELGNL